MRIERSYVDTTAGQLHLRTAGTPSKPTLVLLHQTSSSSAMYEAMMAELSEDFWMIAPDVPGFGQSDPPEDLVRLDSYVNPVAEALVELGVDRAHVFGHHSGTAIALRLERLAPGFTDRMVLSGPAVLSSEVRTFLRNLVRPVVPAADGSHLTAMWERIRKKDLDAPLDVSQRETILNLIAGQVYDKMYRALLEYDFLGDAGLVTCPVLVVAGDRDPLYNGLAPTFERLRDGRQATLAGAGTYVCDRRASELGNLVRDFLQPPETP